VFFYKQSQNIDKNLYDVLDTMNRFGLGMV